MQKQAKIILGIDPGTLAMGFGLVSLQKNTLRLLEMGVLKLSARKDPHERLALIHQKIRDLITHYRPDEFAIEAPFFGKNVQSMLKLGRAQGVAIAAAMHAGIPVTEYSPKKIKQSITGNGNSDKSQVWKMLQSILQLDAATTHQYPRFDASDALAVAVCHHFQSRFSAIHNKSLTDRALAAAALTASTFAGSAVKSPHAPSASLTTHSPAASLAAPSLSVPSLADAPLAPSAPLATPALAGSPAAKSSRSAKPLPSTGRTSRKPAGWEDYLKQNPGKIRAK